MTTPTHTAPVQPDAQFLAGALQDENARLTDEIIALNNNRIYLMATIRQLQSEYAQVRDSFELERMTLEARLQELEVGAQPESAPES